MRFIARVLLVVGIVLLILLIVLSSMAVVLGFAIAIGWLLTRFLPFDLFQASLLALVAATIVVVFWRHFLRSLFPVGGVEDIEFDEDALGYDNDYDRIPATRFFKKQSDKTWEAWLRFHLANSIYFEFQDAPQPVAPMGNKQLQELAIRLADLAVSQLKQKTARATKLRVTVASLRQQMKKMGQQPYDDNILKLTTVAVNEELEYHYQDVQAIIRSGQWDSPYDGDNWEWS